MIKYDKCVYGKLAGRMSGPVVSMLSPRVTSHSRGFPESLLAVCNPLLLAQREGLSLEALIHKASHQKGAFFFQPVMDQKTRQCYMSATRCRFRTERSEDSSRDFTDHSYPQYSIYLIKEEDWINHGALLTLTMNQWLETHPDLLNQYRNNSIRPQELLDLDLLYNQQTVFPLKTLPTTGSPPWALLDILDPPFHPHILTSKDKLIDERSFALRTAFILALLPKSLRIHFSFCGNLNHALANFDLQYLPGETEVQMPVGKGKNGSLSGLAEVLSVQTIEEWERESDKNIAKWAPSAGAGTWQTLEESREFRHRVLENLLKMRVTEGLNAYLRGSLESLPQHPDAIQFKAFWCERIHECLQALMLCKSNQKEEDGRNDKPVCIKASGGQWEIQNGEPDEQVKLDADCFIPRRVLAVAANLIDTEGDWAKAWDMVFDRVPSRKDKLAIMRWSALRGTSVGDRPDEGMWIGDILNYSEFRKLYGLIDRYVGFGSSSVGIFTASRSWRATFFQRLDRLYANTPQLLVINPYNLISAAALPFVAVKQGMSISIKELKLILFVADAWLKRSKRQDNKLAVVRMKKLHKSAVCLVNDLGQNTQVSAMVDQEKDIVQLCVEKAIEASIYPSGLAFWHSGFVLGMQSRADSQDSVQAIILLLINASEHSKDGIQSGMEDGREKSLMKNLDWEESGQFHLFCSSVLHNLYQNCHPFILGIAILKACSTNDSVRLLGSSDGLDQKGRLMMLLTNYLRRVINICEGKDNRVSSEQILELADAVYFYLKEYGKHLDAINGVADSEAQSSAWNDESFEFVLILGNFILEQFMLWEDEYKGEWLRIFQFIERGFLGKLNYNEKNPDRWIVVYADLLKKSMATWARRDDPWLDPIQDLRDEVVRNYLINQLGTPLCRYYGNLGNTASREMMKSAYREMVTDNEKLLVVRGALRDWREKYGQHRENLLEGGWVNHEKQAKINEWIFDALQYFIRQNDAGLNSLIGFNIVYLFSILDLFANDGVCRQRWMGRWERAPLHTKEALLNPSDNDSWQMQLVIEASRHYLGFYQSFAVLLHLGDAGIAALLFGRMLSFADYNDDRYLGMVDRYDDQIIARLETYLLILRLVERNLSKWNRTSEFGEKTHNLARLAMPGELYVSVAEVTLRNGESKLIQVYDRLMKDTSEPNKMVSL